MANIQKEFLDYEGLILYDQNIKNYVEDKISDIGMGAGFHNSIYRGKNLGSSISDAQQSAITNGSFDDMFIGDYWQTNNIIYRIAGFDYWINQGSYWFNDNFWNREHHVVIVPDNFMLNKEKYPINSEKPLSNGYLNSEMFKNTMPLVKAQIEEDFPSARIYTHASRLTNNTDNNGPTDSQWNLVDIDLMTSSMICGQEMSPAKNGYNQNHNCISEATQLPLFRLDPSKVYGEPGWGRDYWLKSMSNPSSFNVVDDGVIYRADLDQSKSLRVVFAIH